MSHPGEKSPEPAGILFPAEDAGWEFFSGAGSPPRRVSDDEARAFGKLDWAALPVVGVSNFTLPAPTADAATLQQAAALQAERLHLKREGDRPALSLWHTPDEAGGGLVLVEILDESRAEAVVPPASRHYATTPHLLPLPATGCAFWREHGQRILAVTREWKLTYYCVLPALEERDRLVQECTALRQQLLFRDALSAGENEIVNWGAFSAEEAAALAPAFPGKWRSEARPAPQAPPPALVELVPVAVAHRREQQQRRQRWTRVALAAAACYLGALGVWGGALMQRQLANRALAQAVARDAAEVQRLQDAARDWELLQPAMDNRYYPLVLLQEIYEVMPANREIRLSSFSLKDKVVELRGSADAVDEVFRFHRNLSASGDLQRFRWTLDNPSIQPDNTAVFRLQGRL